jgi:hypothetical protein
LCGLAAGFVALSSREERADAQRFAFLGEASPREIARMLGESLEGTAALSSCHGCASRLEQQTLGSKLAIGGLPWLRSCGRR